ncbi:hypothetical protein J2X72_004386 [Phyllobacterium sp. 1468]|uniref:hypothetical protein n=1 Tax=Phyllobacterium sp. 1468 TaxID=2817759 RepID=UPI001AE1436B|nr:hypothetical protein [Phyllobacterium sp. 1468]MDR6635572.1 hypothetical protein [Phyllobacterium sp. 1468]
MERNLSIIVPSIPVRHFSRPEDVVRDDALDVQEKRAILASWASDACAVESMPALRRLPYAENPVAFDAVMDALRQLDDPSEIDGNCDRLLHDQRLIRL